MRVTVCGPNLNDQSKGSFHVHAAGCADLTHGAAREPEYRQGITLEATHQSEVILDIYPPEDFGYDEDGPELAGYANDLHFFACCDELTAWDRPVDGQYANPSQAPASAVDHTPGAQR